MIEAHIVADSVSPAGKRLTTFKLRYPKFIHGEFMTHRVISRNASSSRAIPTAKLIEEVRSDALRAAPVRWGKNQAGMQADEELDDVRHPERSARQVYRSDKEEAQSIWQRASMHAADCAEELVRLGAHKQIVNRLLEPFSHINVVATATEWDNFFGLRLHHAVQPNDDPERPSPGYGLTSYVLWRRPSEHGNLVGWRQYRKMLPNEAVAPLPKEYAK